MLLILPLASFNILSCFPELQEIKNEIDRLGLQVKAGELSPARAAEQILKHLSRRE